MFPIFLTIATCKWFMRYQTWFTINVQGWNCEKLCDLHDTRVSTPPPPPLCNSYAKVRN